MSATQPGRLPADGRTRVAFIGGLGRSGSTLLCRLLEGVDGIVSLGEMRNLWDFGVLKDNPCGCGKPFSQCEFWQAVGQKAFGGWDEETARRAIRLRRRVDRLRQVPQLGRRRDDDFGRAADEYAGMISAIYRAAVEVTGATVVLDSSKVPSTGYLMARSPQLEPRVLHLVRDSRGVAHSWNKVVQRADADRTMRRSSPASTAVRWGAFNLLTARLRRSGLPVELVRYEDLIDAPADTIGTISTFLGVATAPSSLDWVRGEAIDLPVDHSVWGNPVRASSGPTRLRRDDAWRTGLTRAQRVVVTALSAPGLLRYGYLTRGKAAS